MKRGLIGKEKRGREKMGSGSLAKRDFDRIIEKMYFCFNFSDGMLNKFKCYAPG